MEPEFHHARATSKDFETRSVAWKYNEIWYQRCVAECMLSKDANKLLLYRRLAFDKNIQEDELPSSEVGANKAANPSESSVL